MSEAASPAAPAAPPGPAGGRVAAGWGWWLGASALFLVGASQVFSFLVTSDAAQYVHLGRLIAELPPGSPGWRNALTVISPLWPCLLAAARLVGGPFAPFGVNPAIVVAWLGVLMALYRRRHGGTAAAGMALMLTLALVVRADPAAMQWLAWPYREPTAFLLLGLAWLALDRGQARGSTIAFATAGGLLVLASAAREPMVFALPGFLLAVAFDRGVARRTRAVRAAWILLPFVAVAAIGLVLRCCTGLGATAQAQGWLAAVRPDGTGSFAAAWASRVGTLAAQLAVSLGPAGLALTALAFWRSARRRELALLFGLPALLLLLFHGFFLAAPRYALASLVMLTPVAAEGLAEAVTLLRGLALRRRPGLAAPGRIETAVALSIAVAALLPVIVWPQLPLGPRHGYREIAQFCRDFRPAIRPGTVVFTEIGCREVESLVTHYLPCALGYSSQIASLHAGGTPVLFLEPQNDECAAGGRVDVDGLRVFERLHEHGDFIPAPGVPPRLRFGDGWYRALELVEPRTQLREVVVTAARRVTARVLWLDFRDDPAAATAEARLSTRDGAPLHAWTGVVARGWQPLFVPSSVAVPLRATLTVESGRPLLDGRLVMAQYAARPVILPLDNSRRASTVRWFDTASVTGRDDDKYPVVLRDGTVLTLPLPRGSGWSRMFVGLELSAAVPAASSLVIEARSGDSLLAAASPGAASRPVVEFAVPAADAPSAEIRFTVRADGAGAPPMVVRRLLVRVE